MNIQELLKADRIAEDDVLAAAETIVTARRRRKPVLQNAQVCEILAYVRYYNIRRRHSSLGNVTPDEFERRGK